MWGGPARKGCNPGGAGAGLCLLSEPASSRSKFTGALRFCALACERSPPTDPLIQLPRAEDKREAGLAADDSGEPEPNAT